MSIAECDPAGTGDEPNGRFPHDRRLHRLGDVRRRKRISRKTAAEQLHVDVDAVRRQEHETADLLLSTLYQWQQLLAVPVTELLVDSHDPLALPNANRRKMATLFQTVLGILKQSKDPKARRMAHTLVDQLIEVMPDLQTVAARHGFGRRRCLDAEGRVPTGPLPIDLFLDTPDL